MFFPVLIFPNGSTFCVLAHEQDSVKQEKIKAQEVEIEHLTKQLTQLEGRVDAQKLRIDQLEEVRCALNPR